MRQRLVDLPPFIDETEWNALHLRARRIEVRCRRLLTVAMMRPGDKAAILSPSRRRRSTTLQHLPWSLDIVGDGEARGEVETLFAKLGSRVRYHGACDGGATSRRL